MYQYNLSIKNQIKMNFFALSTLCVILIAAQALAADESSKIESRVMGGQYAFPGQFPYQVSIRNRTNFGFATGAIISNRWILTTGDTVTWNTIASMFVVLGAHHKANYGTVLLVRRSQLSVKS